jgi:hypothetical protein
MDFLLYNLVNKVVFNYAGTICAERRMLYTFFEKFLPIRQLHVENTDISER